GVTEPNLSARREIARCVEHSLFLLGKGFPRQRTSLQKKVIDRIHKNTRRLIDVLDWNSNEDESDEGYNQMYAVYDLLTRGEQKKLLALLTKLGSRAENILARLPKPKGGRDIDEFAWSFVVGLAYAYEAVTKKQPTITYNDYGPPDAEHTPGGNVGI